MIVALSGKKQSGKDTVGDIIQWLVEYPEGINRTNGVNRSFNSFHMDIGIGREPEWEKKSFASKLKQMACLLIGCTMEQLEDNEFKEKELGEEWNKWKVTRLNIFIPHTYKYFSNKEYAESEYIKFGPFGKIEEIKMTPRLLLQLLGTECGRDIIHPNIWVNALMSDYKAELTTLKDEYIRWGTGYIKKEDRKIGKNMFKMSFITHKCEFPNWIITDVRFPNEVEAIEKRDGAVIRVDRRIAKRVSNTDLHYSEIALDTHTFEYTIINDGTIEQLIEKVRLLLIKLKIIE